MLLTGQQIPQLLREMIYQPTQIHPYSFDLTLKEVFELTTGGSCDFGGSEFCQGKTTPIPPHYL
jgi:hypothetical protein